MDLSNQFNQLLEKRLWIPQDHVGNMDLYECLYSTIFLMPNCILQTLFVTTQIFSSKLHIAVADVLIFLKNQLVQVVELLDSHTVADSKIGKRYFSTSLTV